VKLPVSWVRDWIEVEATPEAMADALTRRGFYVEGIEAHGRNYPGVVVARVLEVGRHPNADRLSLCRVDGGGGELRVVCGAPNVRAGMVVPLATVGATLPGGLVIKRSKIRGEESQGMLCSARELEIADDHEGILDLATFAAGAAAAAPGTPLDSVLEPPDAVLEVEVPFNRPDGLGVVGLAREIRAEFDGRWTAAALARLQPDGWTAAGFDVALEDVAGCPRYIAQVVEGVVVGPSPRPWVRRLEAAGQRSINNVVDATNLVLFELGQPQHAFDLDRLQGPAIRVRAARAGERLVTLDGRERELDPEVLVIADAGRAVALAGIMGGADSEVSDATTRLLLECAWFDPRRVRRGSRRLGLATEASKRFERCVDPAIGPAAVARFVELMRESVPGLRLGPGRDENRHERTAVEVPLRVARFRRLVGRDVAAAEAAARLEAMGFAVAPGEPMRVTVPSWRADVTLEDDLVEEVARAAGYDAIPEAPLSIRGVHATRSPRERFVLDARRALLARGFHEAWCTTLVSEREAAAAAALTGGGQGLVRLENPMSRESEVLRPNLVPGLLRACAHNLRQGAPAVRLFEIGSGFLWGDAGDDPPRSGGARLPVETAMVAAVACGPVYAHAHGDDVVSAKDTSLQPVDFLAAKGMWEAWLEELRVDTPRWRAYSGPGWKPGASAEVASGTSRIGWAGTLGPTLLRDWDIEAPVHLLVALVDPLLKAIRRPSASLPGRFPPVRRDLAFFVPAGVRHEDLEQALARAAGERMSSIELFDVYAGPGTPHGMKSMAYALQFQDAARTLTEPEVQAIQDRMVAAVAKDFGGRLRER
jgi:phenylalanyl-tRNA synthetase beta chain